MRIFLKIFLTFWLTVIIVALSVGWVGYQFRGRVESKARHELTKLLTARHELWLTLQSQGPEAARGALDASRYRNKLFLVGPQGQDLLGRPLPAELQERQKILRDVQNNSAAWNLPGVDNPRFVGYHIFLSPPSHPFWDILVRSPWLLLLALAVSSLVAYALARHLSRPIDRLRLAAGRLAQGDLTARAGPHPKRLHDELSELTLDFDQMAGQLEDLVGTHRRLLRDMSHELRTPLARMRLALGLAEKRGGTVDTVRLEREVEKLDQLVEQVLTVARLDAGENAQIDVLVDVSELLAMIVQDAAFEAEPHGKLVHYQRPENDAMLLADDRLLRAALENVIRNAVRYTPPGTTVEIALISESEGLAVRVRDHGEGVPEDSLSNIFKPFHRVEDSRDRRNGGFGLGLAIAARAIKAHGGEIKARNCADGGLEVAVELPAHSLHAKG